MGSGRTLTTTEREKIDAFKVLGLSGREIARRLDRSKTVVNRYLADPQHYGENQKGRTAEATTMREKRLILQLASNPTLPVTIIKANSGVSASIATVRRIIRKRGISTQPTNPTTNQAAGQRSRSSTAVVRPLARSSVDIVTSQKYSASKRLNTSGAIPDKAIIIQQQDDFDDGDFSDSYVDLSSKLEVSVSVDGENDYYEPSTKMPKIQTISLDLDELEALENNKEKIRSYKDALTFLKPLEDFALQMEDLRAIGLLAQLEAIFKLQQQ